MRRVETSEALVLRGAVGSHWPGFDVYYSTMGNEVQQRPSVEDGARRLLPLTPAYDDQQHRSYVDHLRRALNNPAIHNIALTGHYGVGKSSILEAIRKERKDKVLRVSLSSLGGSANQSEDAAGGALTNRIQKEIVK